MLKEDVAAAGRGLLGAVPALGCASLAALAYAGTVEWIAPELSLLLPLLAVFVAALRLFADSSG